jgi:hypothetical protein
MPNADATALGAEKCPADQGAGFTCMFIGTDCKAKSYRVLKKFSCAALTAIGIKC